MITILLMVLTVSGSFRPNVSGRVSASRPASIETPPNNKSGKGTVG